MSKSNTLDFDSEADTTPLKPGQLSSNGQWVFGGIFAGLILIGFGFGVWTGAPRSKPTETADAKKDKDKDNEKLAPPTTQPPKTSTPTPPDTQPKTPPEPPMPKEEPKKPDPPEVKKPDPPEIKKPDPEPKKPDPEPKKPVKAVAFKEIQPILRTYCGNCHGMAGKPKANIDLRTVAAIKKGGDTGDILKAGEPMKSKLYTSLLVGATEPMPPPGKPAPSEKEIMLIHDWIASGAKERRRPVRVRRRPRSLGAQAALTGGDEKG